MSTTPYTYVRARIDSITKERATQALDAMGLSVSDAIRMLLMRVADEQCLFTALDTLAAQALNPSMSLLI